MTRHSAPLRVLFLLQRPEAWGNVASIWRAMATSGAFHTTAWLLPYDIADPRRSALQAVPHRRLLQDAGIPFVEWDVAVRLERGQFDVAVFTHPYDRERPADLWFDQVRACVPRIVYVPYGLSVGAGAKNLSLQFAQPVQCGADLIVARSNAERDMYARHCPAGSAHVQVLGHPRFDRLLAELDSTCTAELDARIAGRVAFLWNAHFSFVDRCRYNANFSTFDLLGPEVIRFFAANADRLCLVWRPHPALLGALQEQGLVKEQDLPRFRDELKQAGIVLDESADHLPAFRACQALLSDPGSFWLEYLAVGKPMLPMINSRGEPLNMEAKTLLETLGRASSPADVLRFVRAVVSGERRGDEEARARILYLPMLDGHAGMRICLAIAGHAAAASELRCSGGPERARRDDALVDLDHLDWSCREPVVLGPVLTGMLAGLERLRSVRQSEGEFRHRMMRFCTGRRSLLVEWIKRRPRLMRLLEWARRTH